MWGGTEPNYHYEQVILAYRAFYHFTGRNEETKMSYKEVWTKLVTPIQYPTDCSRERFAAMVVQIGVNFELYVRITDD